MTVSLLDVYPTAALTAPGDEVTLRLEVANDGPGRSGRLVAELRESVVAVASASVVVDLIPGKQCIDVPLRTPATDARGYEAVLELEVGGRSLPARTSVLVASHWRHAPRYGFVSEFPPGEPGVERVQELAKYHINVVQFYDWMYRHYRFTPPADEFEDAMGRLLSLTTLKQRIEACHLNGMAALAYGAVYGAEPEYIEEREEEVLRNANGEMLSLIDLFFITDIRPASPWRERILREFENAVESVGFDGIHMDQYGFPKWSYDDGGNPVNLSEHFSGLIDEAARRVAEKRPGAAVLFNAVNNWPIEQIAGSDQAAVYIEVWPPHEHYRDLYDLIRRARDLSGKQVILAAYLEPFREGGQGAEFSALLATAVIASAGGFHLLLGEGDAVLRDPYYPNHGRLDPDFAPRMRRFYDHTAANHRFLFNECLHDVTTSFLTGINEEIVVSGAKVSALPEGDAIWSTVRQSGNLVVVNLVNLIGQKDSFWNVPKERPQSVSGLELKLSNHFDVERIVWSSPDEVLPARELPVTLGAAGSTVKLPDVQLWATIVLEVR